MLERRLRRQLGDRSGRLDHQRLGTWWRVWGRRNDERARPRTGALCWKEEAGAVAPPGGSGALRLAPLVAGAAEREPPQELQADVVFAPQDTTLEAVVRVAGTLWVIEQRFEAAKGEVGLDHDEVRRWTGWDSA